MQTGPGTSHLFQGHYGHGSHGHRTTLTAEELAAEAMAADMDRWISYSPHEEHHSVDHFEDWLSNNLPSQTSRLDGIGWVHVRAPPEYRDDESCPDRVGAQESFEQLVSSGRTINRQTLTELAKMHSVTTGKWLFYTSTGLKVDHLWSLIARGVVSGQCGRSAKVSAHNPDEGDGKHVVCIYNNDFTNYDEVMELENSIRKLGIKCSLMYKPDIYTILGVYRNNEWSLSPTIYRSVFDLIKGCSIVSESASFHQMANHSEYAEPHSDMGMVD